MCQENNCSHDNLLDLRHSAEHVLTLAMMRLHPGQFLMAMGPATEDGFYFDFETLGDFKVSENDFPAIEAEMQKIVKENLPIIKKEISLEEARKIFSNNPYKMEWLEAIESRGETVTTYSIGEEFVDICAGPHVRYTSKIKAFKLLSIAGAYWHGDEKNKMLTRIYGTAFDSKDLLAEHLNNLEEAKKRDHRKIGKDLNLFVFSDVVGKGLPLWTPKGAVIRRELERFIVDEEIKRGYLHVYTPDIANLDLYKKSGHYPYYKDSMYAPIQIDEEEYMLRPMTCPHHFELYNSQPHSYKELPMRIAELAKLYRYEKSGELTGLIRVRSFCLADSHIITQKDNAKSEIDNAIDLIEFVAKTFGLEHGKNYRYRLSLGDRVDDKKYFKDDASWDFAEDTLRQVLIERKSNFYEAQGEAAFYGPKIDVQMKNTAGKEDTAFTVQYDFVMPSRFDLKFTNEAGKDEKPIVIHRSSIGAIERIIGFLIEHFAGNFPLWLCPNQIQIIPITDNQIDYAKKIGEVLFKNNIRFQIDDKSETMQNKIRLAAGDKIPYMIIVGAKEASSDNMTISIRQRDGQDLGQMPLADFVNILKKQIEEKTLNLVK